MLGVSSAHSNSSRLKSVGHTCSLEVWHRAEVLSLSIFASNECTRAHALTHTDAWGKGERERDSESRSQRE